MPGHADTAAAVSKLYTCSHEEAVHVQQASHTGNIHILGNLCRPLVSLHRSNRTPDSRKELLSRQASDVFWCHLLCCLEHGSLVLYSLQ